MFDLSLPTAAVAGLTFFVAGLVKGVTGMGLPTVAMGVLGALISPLAAASLLIVPSFVTNVWQLLAGSQFASLIRRLWVMMLTIIIGTIFGSSLLTSGNTSITTAALGGTLVVYAGFTLLARQLHISQRWERRLSPAIGATTGIVTGGTGVLVIPAVPYLQAIGLEKDDLVQALGLSFTVSTIALAAGLGYHGACKLDNLILSVLAVIPALGGMLAGQIIRNRISPAAFRRGFLLCLLLLGAEMMLKPLF